jgi:hypothetical protein
LHHRHSIQQVSLSARTNEAFDNMKAFMAQNVLLPYWDHNKPFHIYTDASDLQLGAVILQDGMPVVFTIVN